MVVGRIAGRLEDEDILAAHIFLDLDEDLLIGKPSDDGLGKRNAEIIANRFSQNPVRIASENLHCP